MSPRPLRTRWLGLPIAAQILGLLLGGLVMAQITTLVLTLLLPPAPPSQHGLAEIAGALRGGPLGDGPRPLVRTIDTLPPNLQSPGWLVSQSSTSDLARLLDVPQTDVRLLFYAPPPFAGSVPARQAGLAPQRQLAGSGGFDRSLLVKADFDPGGPPAGGGGPGGPPPGGMGGPGGPGGFRSDSFPNPGAPSDVPAPRRPFPDMRSPGPASNGPGAPPSGPGRQTGGGGPSAGAARQPPAPAPVGASRSRSPLDAAVFAPVTPTPEPQIRQPSPNVPEPTQRRQPPEEEPVLAAAHPVDRAPLTQVPTLAATDTDVPTATPSRTLAPPVAQGLFGARTSPQVEGEFVAALRTGPDHWVTVRPKPEAFPNSWQRRILLWFAVAFAGIAPVGYLFARRLAAPLKAFAAAAEALGRDPQAQVSVIEGPAEVGRAGRAFNVMQARLNRYIEDRTGMIGAISHDLRTPLARMRFRLERAPPDLRTTMSRDIAQMEEMITSVLLFMRDDATSGRRDRVDLRSVLECVVDDACAAGRQAELDPGPPIEVEIDLLGLQRVFENLVDNAVKYGERARVRLFAHGDEAIAEIEDTGPGLSAAELGLVFKPFYRGAEARASTKGGMGLGLAVSRATVRGHGGDLQLRSGPAGLIAEVRLPLAAKGSTSLAA